MLTTKFQGEGHQSIATGSWKSKKVHRSQSENDMSNLLENIQGVIAREFSISILEQGILFRECNFDIWEHRKGHEKTVPLCWVNINTVFDTNTLKRDKAPLSLYSSYSSPHLSSFSLQIS